MITKEQALTTLETYLRDYKNMSLEQFNDLLVQRSDCGLKDWLVELDKNDLLKIVTNLAAVELLK